MPGYIIHLAEGEKILNLVSAKKNISENIRNEFLIGCLLPDSKLGFEKRISHFWNKYILPNLVRKPDINLFMMKYRNYINIPVVTGYLAHLYLDLYFIDKVWAENFVFYDENGKEEVLYDKITQVYIKNKDLKLNIKDFLSEKYYYGDYSASNEYFTQEYNIVFPENQNLNCPIEEINFSDIDTVFENLYKYCVGGKYTDILNMKVFEKEQLDKLINDSAEEFVERYL